MKLIVWVKVELTEDEYFTATKRYPDPGEPEQFQVRELIFSSGLRRGPVGYGAPLPENGKSAWEHTRGCIAVSDIPAALQQQLIEAGILHNQQEQHEQQVTA